MPTLDTGSLLRATLTYDPGGGAQVIAAVITQAARKKWCEVDAGEVGVSHDALSYFKVGEGGWVLSNGVRIARDPDDRLTDLDCILDGSRPASQQRYPSGERYSFQKTLAGNVSLETSMIVLAECVLELAEGNGGSGLFWEAGIFDSDDVMIVYGVFTEGFDKGPAVTMQRDFRIYRE